MDMFNFNICHVGARVKRLAGAQVVNVKETDIMNIFSRIEGYEITIFVHKNQLN